MWCVNGAIVIIQYSYVTLYLHLPHVAGTGSVWSTQNSILPQNTALKNAEHES